MVWNGHPQVVATISDTSDASMLVAYIAQISISSGKSHNIMMTLLNAAVAYPPKSILVTVFECWLFFGLFLRSTKGWRTSLRNHRQEQWNQMTSSAREEDKPVNHSKPMSNHVQSEQSAAGWWPHQSLSVTAFYASDTGRLDYSRLEIESLQKGHFTLKSTTFVLKRSIWSLPFSQEHRSQSGEFQSLISASLWKMKDECFPEINNKFKQPVWLFLLHPFSNPLSQCGMTYQTKLCINGIHWGSLGWLKGSSTKVIMLVLHCPTACVVFESPNHFPLGSFRALFQFHRPTSTNHGYEASILCRGGHGASHWNLWSHESASIKSPKGK